MKTENVSHLRLISKQSSNDLPSQSDVIPLEAVDEISFEKAAISLIESRATGKISPETIDALVLALQKAKCPQTIVQRSLDVSILLLNKEGDASVCFKYDIANFGRKSLPGRTHRFWFTTPQEDINLSVSTESGIPLEIENLETSPHLREVRIHFPKSLEPADILAYRIQYKLNKDFLNSNFYSIRAWTITSKLSLTILAPENSRFTDSHVALESADGYLSDCPPIPSVTYEYGREKLSWDYRSAKLGDQFRTSWSLG